MEAILPSGPGCMRCPVQSSMCASGLILISTFDVVVLSEAAALHLTQHHIAAGVHHLVAGLHSSPVM